MNVAIDISPLSNSHGGRGIGIYTKFLTESLQKYAPQNSYTLITGPDGVPPETDLIHYPYFDPFFLTLPVRKVRPTVVTVHDLTPVVFPDKFPKGLRGSVKWHIQKFSLKTARRIIADSDNSARDIHRLTGIPRERIDTVYLGPTVKPAGNGKILTPSGFRKKYPGVGRYILYVGDVNWNKNIPGLLRSFGVIAKEFSAITLILAGKAFPDIGLAESREIRKIIHNLALSDRVIMPGYVDDAELAYLYEQAECLVSPSFYEGFGLPVLDAMTVGCPAVVSDTASLREIAGPSVLVSPENPQSIAGGIAGILLMKPGARADLIRNAKKWSEKFSWEKTAAQTVNVYTKALI